MDEQLVKINETASFLEQNGITAPEIGVVLGTGLGKFIDQIKVEMVMEYQNIPHFPLSTVEFHKGKLLMGTLGNKRVLAMQGRFHYYEGYSMQEICFPIRVMKKLGLKKLLLSNAAGGIREDLRKGDLVIIEDHINLLPENPLRGLNDPAFGNRFVDLFAPYDLDTINVLEKSAMELNISLKKGIYASVMGPNLETRAEYRYLQKMGADLVGMSTVPEVIVANHIQLPCAAISVVTDECSPALLKPVNIQEIIEVAQRADEKLSAVLAATIPLL